MIRIGARGYDPAHRAEFAVVDIGQNIGWLKIHVVGPIRSGAFSPWAARLADMLNGIGRRPDGAGAWCVVSPSQRGSQQIAHRLMLETGIDSLVLTGGS